MKGALMISSMDFRALKFKNGSTIRMAKARTTVNRSKAPELPRYIKGPFRTLREGPVMAADLSMKKTGLAVGEVGKRPKWCGTLTGITSKKASEGERLLAMAEGLVAEAELKGCKTVIFSEFYNSKFMLSFRASAGLRGAVLAALSAAGIEALGLAEITARKAVGVPTCKRSRQEPKGYMKLRARVVLQKLGLNHLNEDEGDAAILLMGSYVELGLPTPDMFKPRRPNAPQES